MRQRKSDHQLGPNKVKKQDIYHGSISSNSNPLSLLALVHLCVFAAEVLSSSPVGAHEQLTHPSRSLPLLSFSYIIQTSALLSFLDTRPRRSCDPRGAHSTHELTHLHAKLCITPKNREKLQYEHDNLKLSREHL